MGDVMGRYAFPDYLLKEDIRRCRKKLGLTQANFAQLVGVSVKTVERWEAVDGKITGPIVPLLKLLTENLQLEEVWRIPDREYPLRLYYMKDRELCTLIDVDYINRKVRIRNYTVYLQDRAFGRITDPTFDQYEEFLESRCFPRTRDKMKIELELLGLPFYDPFMIIEKTQGRMAEDDFWIRIERG